MAFLDVVDVHAGVEVGEFDGGEAGGGGVKVEEDVVWLHMYSNCLSNLCI